MVKVMFRKMGPTSGLNSRLPLPNTLRNIPGPLGPGGPPLHRGKYTIKNPRFFGGGGILLLQLLLLEHLDVIEADGHV